MLAHKWFQFGLGSLGLLAWLALYVLARFANRDVRRWKAPLTVAEILLATIWIGLWVTDNERIGNIFQGNLLGLLCASNWLTRRYGITPAAAITTLVLSASQQDPEAPRQRFEPNSRV